MIVLFSLPLAEVDFDQSILYSTIILAILLTGKNRAGKFLATLWEMARWQAWSRMTPINRRQLMFQGLGWGIPLTQIKKLLSVRNVVRKRSSLRKKRGHKHVNRTVRSGILWLKVIEVALAFLKSWKTEKIGMMSCFLVGIVLIFYTGCKRGSSELQGLREFN